MPQKLPRKALIAVSSFNGAIYPDGHKTGVFFVEALHPYEVLTAAGFEVDFASETGTCAFDDISLTPPFLSGSEHAILNNPRHPFMVKIKSQLKKASDLKKEDYGFFFAPPATLLCTTTRKRKLYKPPLRISGTAAASLAPFAMARRSCRASSTPRQANRSSTARP
jgi:hypothetical protein